VQLVDAPKFAENRLREFQAFANCVRLRHVD
jgi:hypothetical protein